MSAASFFSFCVSIVLLNYAKTAAVADCFSFWLFSRQYDLWTSAPRTQRGHLSDPVSITMDAHQAPRREEVRWMISLYPGRLEVPHTWTQHWPIPARLNRQVNSSIASRRHNVRWTLTPKRWSGGNRLNWTLKERDFWVQTCVPDGVRWLLMPRTNQQLEHC